MIGRDREREELRRALGAITASGGRADASRDRFPDLAAALLARRTVESHVAHVFQKLGVRSREQLSQVAARRRG